MGKRSLRHRARHAGVVIFAALTLASCGGDDEAETTAASDGAASDVDLVNEGTLTTCTHLPYEPFQFEQDGEIVGFDVDLVDLVAEELGVEQEIVDTPFEGIQSGEDLNSRKCDIAAAAMTITPEREEKIAFSDPYFDANQALLVNKESGVESLEDLRGETLGVQSGTTGKIYAEENARPEGIMLKDYEDLALQLSSVKSGQIPAAINDIPVLLDYAQDNPEVEVVQQFETGEQYGFGMKKGTSEELQQTVNEVLAQARRDGAYDRIYEKWFGAKPGEAGGAS